MFVFEVPSTFRVDRGMVVSTDVASWQKPRPEAVPFVAPRVSPPQPRTWPNALPGGTSPRRASRTLAVAWDAFEQYRESLHDRASL